MRYTEGNINFELIESINSISGIKKDFQKLVEEMLLKLREFEYAGNEIIQSTIQYYVTEFRKKFSQYDLSKRLIEILTTSKKTVFENKSITNYPVDRSLRDFIFEKKLNSSSFLGNSLSELEKLLRTTKDPCEALKYLLLWEQLLGEYHKKEGAENKLVNFALKHLKSLTISQELKYNNFDEHSLLDPEIFLKKLNSEYQKVILGLQPPNSNIIDPLKRFFERCFKFICNVKNGVDVHLKNYSDLSSTQLTEIIKRLKVNFKTLMLFIEEMINSYYLRLNLYIPELVLLRILLNWEFQGIEKIIDNKQKKNNQFVAQMKPTLLNDQAFYLQLIFSSGESLELVSELYHQELVKLADNYTVSVSRLFACLCFFFVKVEGYSHLEKMVKSINNESMLLVDKVHNTIQFLEGIGDSEFYGHYMKMLDDGLFLIDYIKNMMTILNESYYKIHKMNFSLISNLTSYLAEEITKLKCDTNKLVKKIGPSSTLYLQNLPSNPLEIKRSPSTKNQLIFPDTKVNRVKSDDDFSEDLFVSGDELENKIKLSFLPLLLNPLEAEKLFNQILKKFINYSRKFIENAKHSCSVLLENIHIKLSTENAHLLELLKKNLSVLFQSTREMLSSYNNQFEESLSKLILCMTFIKWEATKIVTAISHYKKGNTFLSELLVKNISENHNDLYQETTFSEYSTSSTKLTIEEISDINSETFLLNYFLEEQYQLYFAVLDQLMYSLSFFLIVNHGKFEKMIDNISRQCHVLLQALAPTFYLKESLFKEKPAQAFLHLQTIQQRAHVLESLLVGLLNVSVCYFEFYKKYSKKINIIHAELRKGVESFYNNINYIKNRLSYQQDEIKGKSGPIKRLIPTGMNSKHTQTLSVIPEDEDDSDADTDTEDEDINYLLLIEQFALSQNDQILGIFFSIILKDQLASCCKEIRNFGLIYLSKFEDTNKVIDPGFNINPIQKLKDMCIQLNQYYHEKLSSSELSPPFQVDLFILFQKCEDLLGRLKRTERPAASAVNLYSFVTTASSASSTSMSTVTSSTFEPGSHR